MKDERIVKIANEIMDIEKKLNEGADNSTNLSKKMEEIMSKLSFEDMILVDDYILSIDK